MKINHQLWQEKYRPTTLDGYINSNEELARIVPSWLKEKFCPHLLLVGPPGTGKTTLAQIIGNGIVGDPADLLFINASLETSIDTVRSKIETFAYTSAIGDGLKVIILDEGDRMSVQAMDSLKAMIERVTDSVRFIITSNNEHLVLDTLKSRMQKYYVQQPDEVDLLTRCVEILDLENVEFDVDVLTTIIQVCGNDLRKVIQELQRRSVNGVLTLPSAESKSEASYKYELLDLIVAGNWNAARQLVCKQAQADEWEDIYRFLYTSISNSPKFAEGSAAYGEAIVNIAEHLYRHAYVADAEINMAALFIKLGVING